MARTVASLPAGSRITDCIRLGVIMKFFPLAKVREVLTETRRAGVHQRDQPARVVVYCVIALALSMWAQTGFPSYSRYVLSSGGWPATQRFPPRHRKALNEAILDEILEKRVVSRRNRTNVRGVKRRMSNYNLRPGKRRPTCRIDISERIKAVRAVK